MLALAPALLLAPVQDVVSLEGVVRSVQLEPVAGAQVFVTRSRWPDVELFRELETDADGRFRLDVPRERLGTFLRERVWVQVLHPDGSLASRGINPFLAPNGWELWFLLRPRETSRLRVVGADGEPLADVRVVPEGIGNAMGTSVLTEELGALLSATTDGDGWVHLPLVALDELRGLGFHSEGHGVQHMSWWDPPAAGGTVELLPVGSVSGRLTGEGLVGGRSVLVTTELPEAEPGSRLSGSATVVSDAEGRFTVPAIVAGTLSARVAATAEAPSGGDLSDGHAVEAGSNLEVTLELVPAVRVAGRVVDAETGRPVPDVDVTIGRWPPEHWTTDGSGRFSGRVASRQFAISVMSPPLPYLSRAVEGFDVGDLDVEDGDLDLGDLSLERGGSVRGTVVDERGDPVAGAWVAARRRSPPTEPSGSPVVAVADASGRFEVAGLPDGSEIEVTAQLREARVAEPHHLTTPARDPLELVLRSSDCVAPGGRVLDAAGRPVAGAPVTLWERYEKDGRERTAHLYEREPGLLVLTGADGTFQAPRPVPNRGALRAAVDLPGSIPAETEWTRFRESEPARFADLVLESTRTVVGVVTDRTGAPVAGARVFQSGDGPERTEAVTDADGRFELPGVVAGPLFVFAEKAGYRFQGTAAPERIVLRRVDEPPAGPTESLPPRPRDDELTVVRALHAELEREARATGEWGQRVQPLELLAAFDPLAALDELGRDPLPEPWYRDYLRRAAAGALLRSDAGEAAAIVATMEGARWRCAGHLDMAAAVPPESRDERLGLLTDALVEARAVDDPSLRVVHLSQVAEAFTDLGEHDTARQILVAAVPVAEELAPIEMGAYARGRLAESLAVHDLDAALALVEEIPEGRDGDRGRYLANVAHELADRDAEAAERVLGLVRSGWQNPAAVRVAHRMAPVDPPRARRIAAALASPYFRAQALAGMARSLSDPDLLEAAYAELAATARRGEGLSNAASNAACVAAALLPAVEALAPERLPELFWRSLAMRLPWPDPARSGSLGRDATLALLLARYDLDVARQLVARHVARLPELSNAVGELRVLFPAVAATDPLEGAELLRRALACEREEVRTVAGGVRSTLAGLLARTGEERWKDAVGISVRLTELDEED